METISTLAHEFLSQKMIAVVGVSVKKQTPANAIYKKLKSQQRTVIAVSPHLEDYDGDPCYHDLLSIPQPVDGVFISTNPENTERIVEQCIQKKIPRVWMHYVFGVHRESTTSALSSVSRKAVARCNANNITVIDGACPMMFLDPVDGFHSCLRWFLSVTGKLK